MTFFIRITLTLTALFVALALAAILLKIVVAAVTLGIIAAGALFAANFARAFVRRRRAERCYSLTEV